MRILHISWVVAAAVLAAACASAEEHTCPAPEELSAAAAIAAARKVEVVSWQHSQQTHVSLASLLHKRVAPLILRGTAVGAWPARRKWTLQHIANAAAQQGDRLSGFFRQRGNAVFGPFYNPARPMHQLPSVQRINPYEEDVSLPVTEVCSKYEAHKWGMLPQTV